jgi:cholest-4-en-3-one 26-monooxygenase
MRAPLMSFHDVDLLDLNIHIDNPEPLYEWLREEEPLFWDQHNEVWAASRYEDVIFISRNTDIFCSKFGVVPNIDLDTWPDDAMINKDGRDHTVQRALVSKGFSPRNIREMEVRVRELTVELIDKIAGEGSCDVVSALARPLPMLVMGDMLGYTRDASDMVLGWTDTYVAGGNGPQHLTEDIVMAFGSFVMFHEELMESRRENPGDDLLSTWMKAEINGERLTDEKIMYEHNLLLVGGSETTRHTISGGLLQLMRHPEQRQHLIDHPEAIPNAVEEIIRWTTPFIRMARHLTRDHEMHGKMMKAGQQVMMLYPSANRDPRIWDRPQEFDITRSFSKPALSFGFGKHYCLGAALARMEIKVMLEELLKRLPDMAESPDQPSAFKPGCFLRGLESLPVVFTAR